ncbi:MAG: site-specific DNA-methyltransferase [Phycisphaerae bacterium]|nr:site-specific DNA-methyltransferase [Phycisphaerae bacterium]
MIKRNEIIQGDCIEILGKVTEPAADLIFADPPFNIGYKYDVYEDRKAYDEYYQWTHDWMAACQKILKPNGSFWVAIGDDYAAEVRVIARKLGLNLRNWVIWHYTFGQATKNKFARSHTHLFYFTNTTNPKAITFNDMEIRVPSARQTTYADKRANPKGKIPDDVWSFSRVCGTFNERVKWHPCQMPQRVLERIIKVSSNPGDMVIDPFSGSGTTMVAAAMLGREYFGTDLSEDYVAKSKIRIADTLAGRCKKTDISENPVAKRPGRKVGGGRKKSVAAKSAKPSNSAPDTAVLFD